MKLNNFLQLEDKSEYKFIDVRPQKFFDISHINGAINLDWYNPKYLELIDALSRDEKYAVYCGWGCRSDEFVALMKSGKFKFPSVVHLEGSIEDFAGSGLIK